MDDIILKTIPHRPPFLFVDRVIEMNESSIVAEKTLDPGLDFFRGHYPDFPIMPGVLTCESLFQAGAILLSGHAQTGAHGVPVLTRIRDARFRAMVKPGETLTLDVEIKERVDPAFYMKGAAKVNGKPVVSVTFTCAMAPVNGLSK